MIDYLAAFPIPANLLPERLRSLLQSLPILRFGWRSVVSQKMPNSVGSVTVFVGFEGARLRNLIADSEPEVLKRFNVVFGIPPFKTEWETHSLMENASILLDQQVEEILYAGANNPYSCYEVLLMLYKARDYSSSFEVAPLGTKPAAIASALFAAEHRGVSVRYDYPRRSQGRSSGVGKVHLFTAWCDGDVGC